MVDQNTFKKLLFIITIGKFMENSNELKYSKKHILISF